MEASRINVSVRIKPPDEDIEVRSSSESDLDLGFANSIFRGSNQLDVFQKTAVPILRQISEGVMKSASIVVYGQTGTGKTYSIFGPHGTLSEARLHQSGDKVPDEWGLFPRIAMDLVSLHGHILVSAVEIYQECVFDLLNNRSPVKLRSSESRRFFAEGIPYSGTTSKSMYGGFHPPGCSCRICFNARKKDVKKEVAMRRESPEKFNFSLRGETLKDIASNRDVAQFSDAIENARTNTGHLLNKHSSRSHCLVTIHVKDKTILLVDLAGSERIEKSGVIGEKRGQAIAINESLSVFGRVIQALKNNDVHIPFRDSVLTMLMKSCLEAGKNISLIIHISLHANFWAETKASLEFGRNAKMVRIKKSTASHGSVSATSRRIIEDSIKRIRNELLEMESLGLNEHFHHQADPSAVDSFKRNVEHHLVLENERKQQMVLLKEAKILNSKDVVSITKKLDSINIQANNIRDIIARQKTIGNFYIPASQAYIRKQTELKDALSQLQCLPD
jgi:hypothetical protein